MSKKIEHRFDENGTELKRCSDCKEWLPLENFGPCKTTWDKLYHKCKSCNSKCKCDWQKNNPEKYNETIKRFYENNPDYKRVYNANRSATDPEFRLKVLIRNETNKAISRGELIRPKECSLCHTEGPVQAHHVNYTEYDILNPIFVCASCHVQIHSELKKKEENE